MELFAGFLKAGGGGLPKVEDRDRGVGEEGADGGEEGAAEGDNASRRG